MYYHSKYIVIEQGLGTPVPIVFSQLLVHDDVARALGGKVIGAGFCQIEGNQYICYGESTSCRIKSRLKEDAEILNRLLGTEP